MTSQTTELILYTGGITGAAGKVGHFNFAFPPDAMPLESGETLGPISIAFETYGELNAAKSNAILICHGFSGDSHAAGYKEGDKGPGWWDGMIGPGRAFNTDKYYIISSNCIGSCMGSTGPASINPKTGKPHGLEFPIITIRDMVEAQRHLIDALGIDKLLAVAGGSMGGMQALQWLAAYPARVRAIIPIATAAKHSPQQIAFNEVERQAIMADPAWNNGAYYGGPIPENGLGLARAIGHITFMSDKSMDTKFGRDLKSDKEPFKFTPEFQVEGYLRYRGNEFVKRFDANSYLYLTKAMDFFDLAHDKPLHEVFRGCDARVLLVSYTSDWLYPSHHSQAIARAMKAAGVDVTYIEVESDYGHDAFLVELAELTRLIKPFLEKTFDNIKNAIDAN